MKSPKAKPINQVRVLVADDQALICVGLKAVLNRQRDLVCCGEARSTPETLKAVETLKPDLLLLDLWMDAQNGLETIRKLKEMLPSLRILVLSQMDESIYAERVVRAGAHGYLTKENGVQDLMAAIRTVLAGNIYVSPRTTARVLQKTFDSNGRHENSEVEKLTDRELQVLQMLGAGMSTKKIAAEMNLSFKTVESHRENIKHKLKLNDAVELVHFASAWLQGQKGPKLNGHQPG